MDPESVMCPTCLAKPGDQCRSLVPWVSGVEHGQGSLCPPHRQRILKAKGSGFSIVPEPTVGEVVEKEDCYFCGRPLRNVDFVTCTGCDKRQIECNCTPTKECSEEWGEIDARLKADEQKKKEGKDGL